MLNAIQPACEWNPYTAISGWPALPMSISTAMRTAFNPNMSVRPSGISNKGGILRPPPRRLEGTFFTGAPAGLFD